MTLYPTASPRNEFSVRLEPAQQVRSASERDPVDSRASGTVSIAVRDDSTFEYRVTIANPAGETFTGAHLHRGNPGESGPVVATLFANVTLSDPHMQVRGIGEIARAIGHREFIQQLRESSALFYVSVHSTADPLGALRGSVAAEH